MFAYRKFAAHATQHMQDTAGGKYYNSSTRASTFWRLSRETHPPLCGCLFLEIRPLILGNAHKALTGQGFGLRIGPWMEIRISVGTFFKGFEASGMQTI